MRSWLVCAYRGIFSMSTTNINKRWLNNTNDEEQQQQQQKSLARYNSKQNRLRIHLCLNASGRECGWREDDGMIASSNWADTRAPVRNQDTLHTGTQDREAESTSPSQIIITEIVVPLFFPSWNYLFCLWVVFFPSLHASIVSASFYPVDCQLHCYYRSSDAFRIEFRAWIDTPMNACPRVCASVLRCSFCFFCSLLLLLLFVARS